VLVEHPSRALPFLLLVQTLPFMFNISSPRLIYKDAYSTDDDKRNTDSVLNDIVMIFNSSTPSQNLPVGSATLLIRESNWMVPITMETIIVMTVRTME
jgi:hypothetical protein